MERLLGIAALIESFLLFLILVVYILRNTKYVKRFLPKRPDNYTILEEEYKLLRNRINQIDNLLKLQTEQITRTACDTTAEIATLNKQSHEYYYIMNKVMKIFMEQSEYREYKKRESADGTEKTVEI